MRPDSLFIAGVGSYLPPVMDCADAIREGWCDETYLDDGWLGATVAGDMSPCEMAVTAGELALSRARMGPEEVDILFHAWSNDQGPAMWLPQAFVEHHLIGRDIPAIGLWQGCVGVWASAELAACYLHLPGREAAIVTGADNLGFDPVVGKDPTFRWKYAFGSRTGRVSVAGDAGVAMVLSRRRGFARILAMSNRSLSRLEEAYRGGEPLFPPAIGTGRPVRLGRRIRAYADQHPDEAAAFGRLLNDARTALARDVLNEAQLKADDIARVLHVHAGNSEYIDYILRPLGIEADKGMLDFGRRVGHLGVGDQIAALEHLIITRQIGPGDRILVMANGIGAALAAAVVEIDELPCWKNSERG